jgi:16S rRNA (adenine1518-N6/adenine1519-N6)-dimethyltransferase
MNTRRRKTAAPLGQHLLTNPTVAQKVALAAGVTVGTNVLEIGPGKGMLTKELLALGALVTAVEKDPAMVAVLKEVFAKEIKSKQLILIEGDARELTADKLFPVGEYVVAANIPYYITGELIRDFLTAHNQPTSIALLVQKEVAERIARSKKESILSLSVKIFGNPKYVQTVKRGNFNPPPNVDSAILAITHISRERLETVSEENFFKVVKAGFAQKRKTLAGNLKKVFGTSLGVADKIRAEDVPLSEWVALSNHLQLPPPMQI